MKDEMKQQNPIQLILQYYRCADPARQDEIDTCLRNNLQNPFIAAIHLLTEELFDLSQYNNHEKIIQTVIAERLTYERAFRYANEVDLAGDCIWILSNADIWFDDTLRELYNANLSKVIFALSRHDIQSDGTIQLMPEDIAHGSQDSWVFLTPLPVEAMSCGFPLGIPSCDQRIAYELIQVGYIVLNPSQRIVTRHLDLVSGVDIEERIRRYTAVLTETGISLGKAAAPPYQRYLYVTDRLGTSVYELFIRQLTLSENLSRATSRIEELSNWNSIQYEKSVERDGRISVLENMIAERENMIAELQKHIELLKNSMSWKVTRPLRWLAEKLT